MKISKNTLLLSLSLLTFSTLYPITTSAKTYKKNYRKISPISSKSSNRICPTVGFDTIRSIDILDEEKEAGIINFDDFLKMYCYTYFGDNEKKKEKKFYALSKEVQYLKYSKQGIDRERQPPIILHWTDSSNSMSVIRTLFQERYGMKEGVIGVDYIITEPLLNPDYPEELAKSYVIKFSKSEVATTWFHVPNKFKKSMPEQDRKYNKAINIEIVGWGFLTSKSKKRTIREGFRGDFENLETKYTTYSVVLKFLNFLSEKHNFGDIVDTYLPENEIDKELKEKKNITYLNGPLSQYIKGHGLIALEHTLMFGGDYIRQRHDFTATDLLVVYSDLKEYRKFIGNIYENPNKSEYESDSVKVIVLRIQEKLFNTNNAKQIDDIRKEILSIKNDSQKDYLLYIASLLDIKIDNIDKFNKIRRDILYLQVNEKEQLNSYILAKFINELSIFSEDEYLYVSKIINLLENDSLKGKLYALLQTKSSYKEK